MTFTEGATLTLTSTWGSEAWLEDLQAPSFVGLMIIKAEKTMDLLSLQKKGL